MPDDSRTIIKWSLALAIVWRLEPKDAIFEPNWKGSKPNPDISVATCAQRFQVTSMQSGSEVWLSLRIPVLDAACNMRGLFLCFFPFTFHKKPLYFSCKAHLSSWHDPGSIYCRYFIFDRSGVTTEVFWLHFKEIAAITPLIIYRINRSQKQKLRTSGLTSSYDSSMFRDLVRVRFLTPGRHLHVLWEK